MLFNWLPEGSVKLGCTSFSVLEKSIDITADSSWTVLIWLLTFCNRKICKLSKNKWNQTSITRMLRLKTLNHYCQRNLFILKFLKVWLKLPQLPHCQITFINLWIRTVRLAIACYFCTDLNNLWLDFWKLLNSFLLLWPQLFQNRFYGRYLLLKSAPSLSK